MRSPQEQGDFLEHGRFGEGDQNLNRTKVDRLVWVGLLFIATAATCFGSAVLFRIGRDDGGPFFVIGSILGTVTGTVFCVYGFVRMRSR